MNEPKNAENAMPLDGLAAGVDHLEAVVVFVLSHVEAYASWVRPSAHIDVSSVALSFREAFVAAGTATTRLGSRADSARSGAASSRPVSLTIEDGERVAFIQRVRAFGVGIVFDKEAPLGLARAHANKIARTLEHELPLDVAGPPAAIAAVPPVRIGNIGPVSQAAITMMTPTVAAPVVSDDAPPETNPIPRSPFNTDDDRVTSAAAFSETAPAGVAIVSAPPSEPSPVGLRRPTPPTSEAAAPRSAPVPALSLTDTSATNVSEGSDGPPEGRAIRLIAYVEGTSIEPHISVLRLALRSGLGLARLREPRLLTLPDLVLLETAAEEMLGLERGKLIERIRATIPMIPFSARGVS